MAADLQAMKSMQQQVWPTGDYQRVANCMNLAKMSEVLCDNIRVLPHHRVIDIATGTGNTALAAKRRGFPHVTGIDFASDLIDIARERAKADQLDIAFEVGDAEDLPYPDDSFDIVLSTCGVKFCPDQARAASELVRVCRPGGRIGLTAWTPDGDIARFNKTIFGYVPPPPDAPSPLKWGTEDGVRELLGSGVTLEATARRLDFVARSAEEFTDLLLSNFGPAMAAASRLDEQNQQRMRQDLISVFSDVVRPAEDSFVFPGNYLEVIATVR